MKIKKYIADSMPEALQKVKDDLGPRAVLLNTRQLKKDGALGLLSKRKVEITAALDDAPPPAQKAPAQAAAASTPAQPPARPPARQTSSEDLRPAERPTDPRSPTPDPRREGPGETAWADRLSKEIRDLKESLRTLTQAQNHRAGRLPLPGELRGLSRRLEHAGFEEAVISSAVERLLVEPGPGGFEDREKLERQAARLLTHALPPPAATAVKEGLRTVAAFVGASGVGKTTAAAKIAAEFALRSQARVCLVAADVERVGGLDQMRALAGMIGVPLEVVYTPEEMSKVIRGRRDVDLILIDTAGIGPREQDKLKALQEILREAAPNETHLILSAATSAPQMADTAEAFQAIGVNRLLFTKLDETTRLGGVLTMASRSNLPLSYLTDGRSVPGDIRPADLMELALLTIK
ncbi:MAG: flagellar biosynthesis protein FlhF [Candidatus Handelsmanbacteria bacterium RIFCSPLOWO2_12_FULL_64_10]|uniref:Flagellar biosynthesis protein FlhF n=1 Tax=Handelsmanbacteria sp. (strain RIFCSPLOWO2_12_FULL_64_10) TaxID=1817868 RepID=A0A1F6D2F9_HANXR|nr:MAG: flagellar biosynthesis protein FlhF [Candidatus Handelsmanbacteria bacterium RIFCSPLOWO2_12_FULL_64_10]